MAQLEKAMANHSSILASVAAAAAKSLQSCQTLCDPIDGSPPGSPVPGILQARTQEWVAIPFSPSVVFLYFFALFTEEGLLSLLAILWNFAFSWVYLSLFPLLFASLLSLAICRASSEFGIDLYTLLY